MGRDLIACKVPGPNLDEVLPLDTHYRVGEQTMVQRDQLIVYEDIGVRVGRAYYHDDQV